MGRLIRRVTLVAALAFALPATASAQAFLWGAGGVLIPVGDFGDLADAGWLANLGIGTGIGDGGFAIGAEGLYGSASGVSDGPSTDIWGLLGSLGYSFGTEGSVRPYIWGGAGIIGVDIDIEGTPGESDTSDTQFGYQGLVGLEFPTSGSVGFFVEGRYIGSSDLDAIAALAGVSIGLGG